MTEDGRDWGERCVDMYKIVDKVNCLCITRLPHWETSYCKMCKTLHHLGWGGHIWWSVQGNPSTRDADRKWRTSSTQKGNFWALIVECAKIAITFRVDLKCDANVFIQGSSREWERGLSYYCCQGDQDTAAAEAQEYHQGHFLAPYWFHPSCEVKILLLFDDLNALVLSWLLFSWERSSQTSKKPLTSGECEKKLFSLGGTTNCCLFPKIDHPIRSCHFRKDKGSFYLVFDFMEHDLMVRVVILNS